MNTRPKRLGYERDCFRKNNNVSPISIKLFILERIGYSIINTCLYLFISICQKILYIQLNIVYLI